MITGDAGATTGENCATKNVIICIPQQILVYYKMKDDKMDGACNMHRKDIHMIFWMKT
jgi:hypothetical protein